MKLTMVISSLGIGGAQRVVGLLANAWQALGWKLTILTLDSQDASPFFPVHPDVHIHNLGVAHCSRSLAQAIIANVRRLNALRTALRESKPDGVVSFMDTVNVLTILASRGLGIPVVVSERTDPRMHDIGRMWNTLRKLTYPLADSIVVQTRSVLEGLPARWREKATAIANPVTIPQVDAQRDGRAETVFLCVGRLSPEKGQDLLLRTFAELPQSLSGWRLRLVGDGPWEATLKEMARTAGITDRVEFLGRTNTPEEWLEKGGIFVLPSRFEGFPNALLEAMAHGLPCIAFDCPSGPAEIIDHGRTGLLAGYESVEALGRAMAYLADNPSRCREMGAAARAAMRDFGIENTTRRWEQAMAAGGFPVPADAPSGP